MYAEALDRIRPTVVTAIWRVFTTLGSSGSSLVLRHYQASIYLASINTLL